VSARGLAGLPREGERVRLEAAGDGVVSIVRRADGTAIGTLAVHVESDALVVDSLSIDAAYRGYGAGSEAAALLVDAATGSYARIRASAPPHLGLAVYFWVRMGLCPLHGEGPGGGIWFERRL
jgi:hypothetical protein